MASDYQICGQALGKLFSAAGWRVAPCTLRADADRTLVDATKESHTGSGLRDCLLNPDDQPLADIETRRSGIDRESGPGGLGDTVAHRPIAPPVSETSAFTRPTPQVVAGFTTRIRLTAHSYPAGLPPSTHVRRHWSFSRRLRGHTLSPHGLLGLPPLTVEF